MTVQSVAWFEREFVFDLPVWMYPNVVERVRGTPARLEDRLGALPRELVTRRDGGRWSMQEHAGHLLDLGELDLARVEDFRAGRDTLRPADPQNRRTHEAAHNAAPLENILRAFRRERAEFVRHLEQFGEADLLRTALHPRLRQPMRPLDFALFVAEHDDHHLAAISELVRKFV
ncbi:MAG TPA: DinB family protein [Pyrinomonadaceae bacterium]|nr:DinB family protein [Pyrinomonadaceae bacterium]